MRTLAVQAVNDTNSASDRTNLNDEIGKLQAEITRIGNTSTFNNKNLIDGSMTLSTFQVGHKSGETISVGLSDMRASALGTSTTAAVGDTTEVTFAGTLAASTNAVKITLTDDASTATVINVTGNTTAAAVATAIAAASQSKYEITADGGVISIKSIATGTAASGADGDFSIAVAYGATTSHGGTVSTMLNDNVATVTAADGAAAGTAISSISVTDGTVAAAAITALDYALVSVGQERAKLGAFQNRLTHAVNNMTNMSANTAAAKSVIADADYAQESSSLAKNQILQQAGTAMLAQANAQAQSVLSLLK
jgi:flagellin